MELHHNVIIGIIIVIYILFVIGYTTGKNNEFFNIFDILFFPFVFIIDLGYVIGKFIYLVICKK